MDGFYISSQSSTIILLMGIAELRQLPRTEKLRDVETLPQK